MAPWRAVVVPCYARAMLEFARQQWLWLFVPVALFFVAWLLARRYRKQRVTYGRIWERVAAKVLPPAWKRILRTALTLLISGVMLSAVVLYAAGLQRPVAARPAPLVVAIVLDNSPAMRAGDAQEQQRRQAQAIVNALQDDDRALLCWFEGGRPMIGKWLENGDSVGETPGTDFTPPDLDALDKRLRGLGHPPGMPPSPAPRKLAVWIGDAAPDRPAMDPPAGVPGGGSWFDLGVPARFAPTPLPGRNDAVVDAMFFPPGPGDAHAGIIEARTLSGRPPEVILGGQDENLTGPRVELLLRDEPYDVEVRASADTDALPMDDAVRMAINPHRLSSAVLCYPEGDDGPNTLLIEALETLVPGREVRAVPSPGSVRADLVILDRWLPTMVDARFLLCFGVIPPEYGATGEVVRAEPNLQLRVDSPRDLGFEVPELALLSAREGVPLVETKLHPLARHIEGGTLVAIRRGSPEVLYSGFIPHRSTLLQDRSGLLLLLRWLEAVQETGGSPFPPFVPMDSETEFKLERTAELSVELAESPWLPAHGARRYTLATTADGRGTLGPFDIPGEYVVREGGRELGRFTVIWHDAHEQTFPKPGAERLDLSLLAAPDYQPDWRDLLPGLLLWIALGGMLLEWLLWLLGVTE